MPRQMTGSPKKPKPTPNVVIFINIADVVSNATATPGTSIPASLRRYVSLGNGGVGDKALLQQLAYSLIEPEED